MANLLDSRYGKIHRLTNNPRTISDGSYTRLCESLNRGNDIDFLMVRGLVVWKVPSDLTQTVSEEGKKSPFCGQEGKYVILGGNQRYRALQELGYTRVPDEWLKDAKHPDGSWWTAEEAERFVLLDNNPEGIAGETDYDKLIEQFNAECLKVVGMDFAKASEEFQEEMAKDTDTEVEDGEHGEKDEKLTDFIDRREKSRGAVEEMTEVGFYFVPCFETHDQKMKFLAFLKEKFGIEADREVFVNGFDLAEAMGCTIEKSGLSFPDSKPEKSLQELAYDGTKEGWETRGDGDVPVGTDETDEVEDIPDADVDV